MNPLLSTIEEHVFVTSALLQNFATNEELASLTDLHRKLLEGIATQLMEAVTRLDDKGEDRTELGHLLTLASAVYLFALELVRQAVEKNGDLTAEEVEDNLLKKWADLEIARGNLFSGEGSTELN